MTATAAAEAMLKEREWSSGRSSIVNVCVVVNVVVRVVLKGNYSSFLLRYFGIYTLMYREVDTLKRWNLLCEHCYNLL